MSKKETRTISFDPENDRFLSNQDNASALVNDLVSQYRKGADKHSVAIDLQIEQKRRQLREKQGAVNRIEEEIDELEKLKRSFAQEEEAQLEEAKETLDADCYDVTNPAIQRWAEKLDMPPERVVEYVT